jgi:hypothetical protein
VQPCSGVHPADPGALDAAAGGYLVLYAVRREQRDKPGVMVTGLFLLLCAAALVLCAAALVLLGWPESTRPQPAPLPPPAGTSV